MSGKIDTSELKNTIGNSLIFTQQKAKVTAKATNKHTDIQTEVELERATFYIRLDQQPALEELKLNLRKKGIKTDKSELARVALDLLVSNPVEKVEELLNKK